MTYLYTMVAIIACSLSLGVRSGRRFSTWCVNHRRASALAVLSLALAWFALALLARGYADGDSPGWAAAEWFAHEGKWYSFTAVMLFTLGSVARSHELGGTRKATLVLVELVVIGLAVWRTMPSFVWLPRRCLRDSDGHIRQTIEYTCGPVCLGNLLEAVFERPSPTERELARLSGTTVEGTRLKGLMTAATALGLKVVRCETLNLEELRLCDSGAIVQISTIPSVRHATLFLRVHDGMVEFIDPGYGYRKVGISRFRDTWYGKTLVFGQNEGEQHAGHVWSGTAPSASSDEPSA